MSQSKLHRKAQVIQVLQDGGYVVHDLKHPSLLKLCNARGVRIEAWQQAIHSALKALSITPKDQT